MDISKDVPIILIAHLLKKYKTKNAPRRQSKDYKIGNRVTRNRVREFESLLLRQERSKSN